MKMIRLKFGNNVVKVHPDTCRKVDGARQFIIHPNLQGGHQDKANDSMFFLGDTTIGNIKQEYLNQKILSKKGDLLVIPHTGIKVPPQEKCQS